ncbi:hypothetical protein J8L73_14975 [Pseudoalteromonas sp. MMG006]|jgi:uncharacterized membrane protein YebE (DUF533 family)|nr:hypothetical protein [Pseudoalteromonas sp. MMG006]MBQ4800421.1 hypothetical protein [Pseudoalteromonas sp. MMG006]
MPLLLVFFVGGGLGFAGGAWSSDLLSKATKLTLVAGVGYVGYQVYKGGR